MYAAGLWWRSNTFNTNLLVATGGSESSCAGAQANAVSGVTAYQFYMWLTWTQRDSGSWFWTCREGGLY